MTKKDAIILKKLAELDFDVEPKTHSQDVSNIITQLQHFEREIGSTLDPEILKKYLS